MKDLYSITNKPLVEDGPLAVDLFSGAGGLTLGLLNAGFNVVLSSDHDHACAKTHKRNFPNGSFELADVHCLTAEMIRSASGIGSRELDLLAGGPPCQGFSIIGRRVFDDPRNSLFRQFVRLANELRPRAVLMENVPGLATLEGGRVLHEVARAFDEIGYNTECAELLAAQYGVPQMRWRMVIVAWRKDQNRAGGFPAPTHGKPGIGDLVPNRTVTEDQQKGFLRTRDAIGDLPPVKAGAEEASYTKRPLGAYQSEMRRGAPKELYNHYAPKLSQQNLDRIAILKPGEDWRALPFDMLPPSMQRALRKDHTRRYRRMTWDSVPRSIITRFRDPKSGEYIHPEQCRTISIREAARIQSFPDWFVFEGCNTDQYTQVGNAVPPLLGKAIGRAIRQVLMGEVEPITGVKSRYRMPNAFYDAAAA